MKMNNQHMDITKPVTSPMGDVTGVVDAIRTDDSGATIVRVNDHWFYATEVKQAE